jgi:hypothetical protein
MRTACLAVTFLLLAASVCSAQQPVPKTTADNCTPQPDCRLAFTTLKPGAPTGVGMKAARKDSTQSSPSQQTLRPRDSFRIPKSPE